MKRLLLAPLVLVAALLLVTAAAQAQSQALRLDQSQTSYDPTRLAFLSGPSVAAAQMFTAGVTGTLTQVKLVLGVAGSPTGDLVVGVYATSGGVPTGSALGTGSVSASRLATTPAWVSVTISPVPIRAGTQYAIVLSSPSNSSSDGYWIGAAYTNPYAGGAIAVWVPDLQTWITENPLIDPPLAQIDLAFQTYVGSSQNSQGQNGNGQGQNHNGQGENP